MNKNCSERVEEEVIYQGVLVRCRKDCGIYWKQLRKCAIKGLAEYFGYRRG